MAFFSSLPTSLRSPWPAYGLSLTICALAIGGAIILRGMVYPKYCILLVVAWTGAAELCVWTIPGTPSSFLEGCAIILMSSASLWVNSSKSSR
jgi:hypothetical protein